MSDAAQAAAWIAWFLFGLTACGVLARAGVATTYVRDVLHIAAGTWVLGWPSWHSRWVPSSIAAGGAVALVLVPLLAMRSESVARIRGSVTGTDTDERWSGIVLYGISFAVLTWRGLGDSQFPAAGALLALSLGDGIGGAVGRKWGHHRFQVAGGKPKSLEGSIAVAVFSAIGILLAATWFGTVLTARQVILAGCAAALAEAVAPRATDNILLPAVVYGVLLFQIHAGG